MTAIYNFASKLCGSMAGVCAILALLATPTTGRADHEGQCDACCSAMHSIPSPGYDQCMTDCIQGIGDCPGLGPSCTKCTTNCVGKPEGTQCDENGKSGTNDCSAICNCVQKPDEQPNCRSK